MKKEYIRALVIINIIVVVITSLYIIYTRITLELIGDNDIDVTINSVYQDKGIIVKGNFNKLKMDRTIWYSINYEKLDELVNNLNLPLGQNEPIIRSK